MAESWRIFLVEDDEALNQTIVNSLRKDGYSVRGVITAADAMRILWSEEYDVVVCDLKNPGVDSFEFLQWLRTYRSNLRVVMVGAIDAASYRTLALENGAVGYLERPLDLHILKEELRRLSQQTGFSANLDSFDLLDVIQIITTSRKNIALLVSTGLEERGTLRFLNGALVWAEYGTLRGEEAFFALAAHKNGTVVYQAWNGQITPNVTQPLSRLIFQALQYRTKYAHMQLSGEHMAVTPNHNGADLAASVEEDDTPFQVLVEYQEPQENESVPSAKGPQEEARDGLHSTSQAKEWWEQTGKYSGLVVSNNGTQITPRSLSRAAVTRPLGRNGTGPVNGTDAVSSTTPRIPTSPRVDLPSWLTDQPTSASIPQVPPEGTQARPASLPGASYVPTSSLTSTSAEWQTPRSAAKTDGSVAHKEKTNTKPLVQQLVRPVQPASPEWQPPEDMKPLTRRSGPLQSLSMGQKTRELPPIANKQESGQQSPLPSSTTGITGAQRSMKRGYNYASLVSALQTLGYSVNGFIAAAVVSLEGQPIAQVAVDDLDIAPMCKHFSVILKSVLQSLDQGAWGTYGQTLISSTERHILIRVVGNEKNAFLVLITTHESDSLESLEVMANVEGAITAALR